MTYAHLCKNNVALTDKNMTKEILVFIISMGVTSQGTLDQPLNCELNFI